MDTPPRSRYHLSMGLIDIARDTLKDIPMADILRERLSLALDQSAQFESKIETLREDNAEIRAQLRTMTAERDKTREELQRLKDEHSEEVQIHYTIEFRRGQRTAGCWKAFCPKCHLPALVSGVSCVICPDPDCKWGSTLPVTQLCQILEEIGETSHLD